MLKTLLSILVAGAVLGLSTVSAAPTAPKPTPYAPPPVFTLVDTNGKTQSLAAQHGHPLVLLFFCGCNWCAGVSKQWATLQHQGALTQGDSKSQPTTMVVYSGDADSVKSFADTTGLDLNNTILLPDPTMKVTLAYKSDTCPRVFVISSAGAVTYTNNHKDDLPRRASAQAIAYLALGALRDAETK